MAGVPTQTKILTLGGKLPSFIQVDRGSIAVTFPVTFRNKTYDLHCIQLQPGNIQGVEFLFAPEKEASYELLALEASEIVVSPLRIEDLYKKSAEDLFAILETYLPTLQKTVKILQLLESSYLITHRVFHSFIATIGYINAKYNFEVRSGELSVLVEDMNRYIDKFGLASKLFPLNNDLYKIPFEEFNPYHRGVDTINGLYLQRILQLFDYLKKGLGRDKVFNLNLLMDLSLKAASAIELSARKVQTMLGRLEIFLSEDTAAVLREFFQNASRSEEISRYLFLTTRSTESFLEQKAIVSLQSLNQELFLVLKDELNKHGNAVAKIEQNIFSKGKGEGNVSIPSELRNTLEQILNFGEIPAEERKKISEEYNKWKLSPNRMAVDDALSKVRRQIAEYFWRVYVACFKQHKLNNKALTKPVELFFKYGLWDETLLSGDILKALLERSNDVHKDSEPGVYSVYEWLVAVYEKKMVISNSKDGEYPDIMLRDLARDEEQKLGKKIDPQTINTPEFRIDYEIGNLVREASKICNGVFGNYIPILIQEQFPIVDLGQQLLTSDRVQRTFLELRKTDFSAFYREVRYRNDELGVNEFVQKEILPVFILMPGVGLRSFVWQPKERSKETPARIALPAISFANPEQIMMNAFGFFRWEIVKDILGPSWNDISLLSLTSEYSDYESSYKNSKMLDDETKERVAQDFKKYRTTRDRFIHDYIRWITVDSQGRPGVNRALRELFYRQVPFPKEIRARLETMPAYEQLNDRYTILMKREIAKLKLKYQKYQKEDGSLPPELEDYIQFLAR